MTRDRTAELVSRDQFLRSERGQGNVRFPCSADHEQGCWQLYAVDPYSAIIRSDDHTYPLHNLYVYPVVFDVYVLLRAFIDFSI